MKDTSYAQTKVFPLATIGYEGTDIDSFIGVLRQNEIETLVDVRELPLSRKKGFSKNKLREALTEAGINYVHLKCLGDPKEGRLAARAGNYGEFRKIFSAHMETSPALEGLAQLEEIVKSSSTCLLCFERCHTECHRSIVVERLSETTDLKVSNLVV